MSVVIRISLSTCQKIVKTLKRSNLVKKKIRTINRTVISKKQKGSQTDLRSKAAILTEIGKLKRDYHFEFSQILFMVATQLVILFKLRK